MQTNVAVGYAVCYIFGSLGPIIMVSWFLPMVMRWNIRQEAVKLAKIMSGGRAELDPGQFNAVRDIDTRIYEVTRSSKAIGETALAIDQKLSDAAVEAVFRDGKALDSPTPPSSRLVIASQSPARSTSWRPLPASSVGK